MKWLKILPLLTLCFACSASWATSYVIDKRSWSEVTQNFAVSPIRGANDGEGDGFRLKALDQKAAFEFLHPLLSRNQPREIRLKAIGALGYPAFQEAIPALSAIALDATEDVYVRAEALNCGLRYMHHPDAVRAAFALANHKSAMIRAAAYRVLGEHDMDQTIEVLKKRARTKDPEAAKMLISEMAYSERADAARLVHENCPLSAMPLQAVHDYTYIMERARLPEAQGSMLVLLQHADWKIHESTLRYFGSFPQESVVPHLVADIEKSQHYVSATLYETVARFVASPTLSSESRAKLSELIASRRVREN